MKLRTALLLTLAALLVTGSLAFASPASSSQPVPLALSGWQLATAPGGASCNAAGLLAFLPAPLPSDTPVLCGSVCSSALCANRPLGSLCGTTTTQHCVLAPSCTSNEISCRCQ